MQEFPAVFAQPFFRLTQANMELFARYAMPSDMLSQWTTQAQRFFNQAAEGREAPAALPAMPPLDGLAKLVTGLMENYLKFSMELTQGGLGAFAQAPAAFWQQAQEAQQAVVDNVVDVADARSTKPRKAA